MKKNWDIVLIFSGLITLILIFVIFRFIGYKITEKAQILSFNGNHYYSSTFIYPNLSNKENELATFSKATCIGCCQSQIIGFSPNNKLWKVHGIPQKKSLVEITPSARSSIIRFWSYKKIRNIKEAFSFLNPKYISYATHTENKLVFHKVALDNKKKIIQIVKKTLDKKPQFSKSTFPKGEVIDELYFNENSNQCLVLQISLLKTQGNIYLSCADGRGKINYWRIQDNFLKLLN